MIHDDFYADTSVLLHCLPAKLKVMADLKITAVPTY